MNANNLNLSNKQQQQRDIDRPLQQDARADLQADKLQGAQALDRQEAARDFAHADATLDRQADRQAKAGQQGAQANLAGGQLSDKNAQTAQASQGIARSQAWNQQGAKAANLAQDKPLAGAQAQGQVRDLAQDIGQLVTDQPQLGSQAQAAQLGKAQQSQTAGLAGPQIAGAQTGAIPKTAAQQQDACAKDPACAQKQTKAQQDACAKDSACSQNQACGTKAAQNTASSKAKQ